MECQVQADIFIIALYILFLCIFFIRDVMLSIYGHQFTFKGFANLNLLAW